RRHQRRDQTLCQVLDINEVPRLTTIAGDHQWLTGESARGEGREHGRWTRAWAVRDAEPKNGVFQAVQLAVRAAEHLAGKLRRRVEMLRVCKRRVLVARLGARRVAVHP